MIGQVRAAHPAIILGGQDYYNALAPYLVTFSYEDNCDGKKADDLSFELADREGKFISSWMPEKGATLDASIIAERWFTPIGSDITLDCGTFWIDTVEFKLPEHRVTIKCNSIPTDVRLKAGKETRGWEKTSLQDIANQIAGENKMSLDWQADANPRYSRTEMHEESSLGFLMKRCDDAKLAIKVHRNKIVVFDEQKLEEAAAKFQVLYGSTSPVPVSTGGGLPTYRLAGAHFVTKLVDTVAKTKVSHMNPETGEVSSGQFTDTSVAGSGSSSPGRGALLSGGGGGVTGAAPSTAAATDSGGGSADEAEERSTEDTDNESEESDQGNGGPATRELQGTDWSAGGGSTLKAKANARNRNKKKDQCRLELGIGNPLIASGQTFNIVGCGQFDGKWFVETAHHTLGPQYKTELTVRRCLTGY
jgi:Phage protein D